MEYLKKFESLFDDEARSEEESYFRMNPNMFKDLLKDVYDNSAIKISELTENFDSLYIRKDEKRNKLNIILPYKNYNIIIEFIVNNKALVGNVFDNSTYEQLYQLDMPFESLHSIIEMFYSLFNFIRKI